MIKNGLLLTTLIMLLLESCDYEANEHYILDNKSNYNISVGFVKKYGNTNMDTSKVILNPNEVREFYVHITATAVSKDIRENYLDVFDTIYISVCPGPR